MLESEQQVQASNLITPMLHGPSPTLIGIGLLLTIPGVVLLLLALIWHPDLVFWIAGGCFAVLGLMVALAGVLGPQHLFVPAVCCNQFTVQMGTPQGRAVQSHTFHIAMLMPPWEQQQILRVSVDPRVPLSKMHQFAAHFQDVLARFQDHGVERLGRR